MNEIVALINGIILTPLRKIENGIILVKNGQIKDIGSVEDITIPQNSRIIDAQGRYVSPGFIDLHLHGAWGGDATSGSVNDLLKISKGLVKNGTTAFLPTTVSGALTQVAQAIDCIHRAMAENSPGAIILGVHVEGPYINKKQTGAQNPEHIIAPRPKDYLGLLDKYPHILRVSAAPEIEGALELGQELKRRGKVASIAHSDATYQQVLAAVENGYTHATHMYSGMSGIRRVSAYRVSGVIESVLLLDELTTEIIGDGHHLPPSLMKLVLKTKGLAGVCVVTDSMSAAGLGPGVYDFGGLEVIVESDIPDVFETAEQEGNYVAKLIDRSAFAGSVATMDQIVRNMIELVGLNILDAVKLATLNPAKMQGLEDMGILAKGMQANLVVFDRSINIKMTMVNGEIKYTNW